MPNDFDVRVQAIRHFNRFYTKHVGALNEGLLKSPYSLTEMRVLYDLAYHGPLTARDLSDGLNLDPGYLSRILSAFRNKGMIKKTPSEKDRRRLLLTLTAVGKAAFDRFDAASQAETGEVIGKLSDDDQIRLVDAMATIESLLSGEAKRPAPVILRDPRPGDMGWVVHRQAALYWREYRFDNDFEALIAEIVGKFILEFDPAWERCWIAEQNGSIVGSVFVVRQSDKIAKLRLLYLEPQTRGQGVGKQLVNACIQFAQDKGYHQLTLWTNDNLAAAGHIYKKAGFKLIDEEPHHSFGQDLVGQTWTLDLS
jgi:DNA-binding MarR family transcriptional regulator/GNAT superfamily N-acetyltransferase